jgi:hypothetical protein
MLGESDNQMGSPNSRHENNHAKGRTKKGTRNPQKYTSATKYVNPFTHALESPFIGRRRDFYFPRLPSNLENIPDVNMYTNVFYITGFTSLNSHIYKSLPQVHTPNQDF